MRCHSGDQVIHVSSKTSFFPFVGQWQAKKKQQVESDSEESEAVEAQCAATVTHESE